jgi:hypothetical protein
MGEIVNLRRVKKAKQRAAAAAAADENRVRHGRTAAQTTNDERARQRQARATEGARLDARPHEPG